jgi:hypothetical protein
VPAGELSLPSGVGFRFEPGAVVLMQAHYLNAATEARDAEVRLNLWFAPEPVAEAAGTLFFYQPTIFIPPFPGTATATMRCAIDQDLTLLLGFSHMHRRGTRFVSSLHGAPLVEPSPLHESYDWQSPTPTRFDPPVSVSAGQSIQFSCEYENDRDEPTIVGSSAKDNEMCIFASFYYPRGSDALEACEGPESGPIWHGSDTCVESIACLDAAGPAAEVYPSVPREGCAARTCEGASQAYGKIFDCPGVLDCAYGTLAECLPMACPEEWAACEAASCDAPSP